MKRSLLFTRIALIGALLSLFVAGGYAQTIPKPTVLPGIDVLRSQNFAPLKGKRIGIITNPTGVTYDLQHIVDVLRSAEGVIVVALFGPEHGVRGDVEGGVRVDTYVDEKTGITVYSLYGRTNKPTPEMLKDIDALVYDIQDIGCRSYTYISTMGVAMEAAAENNKEFIVLDRPNPLNGLRVEGPMLDTAYVSFIGRFPVPYVYGMTAGELAQMINGERWLANGVQCKLTVIPMEGWKRSMEWDETGLHWVPTSPHVPHSDVSYFYVLTGTFGELQTVNQGVGYTMPFELVGTPYANGEQLAAEMNARKLPGVYFRPMSYKPFYFDTTGRFLHGIQVHLMNKKVVDLTRTQLNLLDAMLKLYPQENFIEKAGRRINSFDRANGGTMIREELLKRTPVEEIMMKLEPGVGEFKAKRKKYLIYK